jgi:hypothetical protein
MAQGVALRDPKETSITINAHPVSGFAADTYITIAMDNDAFTDSAGADGEVVRSKTNDSRATVTLTLQETSQSNNILSTLHNADILANGAGVFAFSMRDQKGKTLVVAPRAWVVKFADVARAQAPQATAWTIRLASAKVFVGGANVSA